MAENLREKMPILQRAKQFAPFQSLKGFEDALKEKEKIYLSKKDVTVDKEIKINHILNNLKKDEKITVTYFNNGDYISIKGLFKRIDIYNQTITVDECKIPINDIWDLDT